MRQNKYKSSMFSALTLNPLTNFNFVSDFWRKNISLAQINDYYIEWRLLLAKKPRKVSMWSFFSQLSFITQPPCLLCGAFGKTMDNLCIGCYQDLPHTHTWCQRCGVYLTNSLPHQLLTCGTCLNHPPTYHLTYT